MLVFVEDVGRHNAIDTIAGWMWLQDEAPTIDDRSSQSDFTPMTGADKVFYTTGRLTSEMVIKSAQMGVPIVVSRSGITQMGYEVARRVGLCAIGRATNKHFLCYSGAERLQLQPELAGNRLRAAA
jgi:FdhD protein